MAGLKKYKSYECKLELIKTFWFDLLTIKRAAQSKFRQVNIITSFTVVKLCSVLITFSYCYVFLIKMIIYGALRDLVPFAQIKRREKHPQRSITFSKVPGFFTKSNTPPWVFFTFLKLCEWYQIVESTTYLLVGDNSQEFPRVGIGVVFIKSKTYCWSSIKLDLLNYLNNKQIW